MEHTRSFLELGLRLGRHLDEFVDGDHGPDEIAQRVESETLRDPALLVDDANELLASISDDRWLAGQVRALCAHARKLTGEAFTYDEEGSLVYGITPRWHDEDPFRRAAVMLDEALPGAGDLRGRLARWQDETAVPRNLLEPAVRAVAAELRRLARETVGLPDDESFELELVEGKRWTAYAKYLGGLRTRISFNTDLPMLASDLVNVTAHEIYGGHHTHHVWQEAELVRDRNELEWTLTLLWAPTAVIAEGIATTGPQIIAGDGQELAAALLGKLGFAYDAAIGVRVMEARRLLQGVSANVAMLLHRQRASVDEAREYAATWSLQPDERLDRLVARQAENPSPVYQHCYWQGRELVNGYVRDDPKRFRELLTLRVLPADLGEHGFEASSHKSPRRHVMRPD